MQMQFLNSFILHCKMNTKNLIALFVALVVCFAAVANASAEFEQFNDFIKKHNKKYSMEEFHARFAIFKDNLVRINKYNQMSKTAKFGVNQFADLTADEFRSIYLSKTPAVRDPSLPVAEEIDLKANPLPASFDWREKGAVTPVKNQGQCGSCWSFSTTGNIEGQWFLAGHNLTSLSEQNLVDCDHHCMEYDGKQSCDNGCNGGLQPNAFQYVIDNGGIDTEASYPYTGVDGQCKFKASNIGAKIDNFTMVSTDEDQIAAYLVQHGPLSIAADAAEWQFYMGGIFDIPCGKELDHGILMVGFGTQKNWLGHETPYWIIKNSWGPSWGEDGYILIERGSGKCGLNTFVSSAIIY